MSHAKVAPKGLKPQEYERNAGRSNPPIPYTPKMDVIQEAVDSSANTLKLTLPHKVELRIPVWSKGTPKQFQSASNKPLMLSGRKASSWPMRKQ